MHYLTSILAAIRGGGWNPHSIDGEMEDYGGENRPELGRAEVLTQAGLNRTSRPKPV